MDITIGREGLSHSGDIRSYDEARVFSERLFAAAAALWPNDHAAHLEDIEAQEAQEAQERQEEEASRPARTKPGGRRGPWKAVKPGSLAADIVMRWRNGLHDLDALAELCGRPKNLVAMTLAKLRKAGLLEEAA